MRATLVWGGSADMVYGADVSTTRNFALFSRAMELASAVLRMSALAFLLLTVIALVFAAQNWIVGGPYGRLAWPRNVTVALTQWWAWAAIAPLIMTGMALYPITKCRRRICAYLVAAAIGFALHLGMVTLVEWGLDRVSPGEPLKLTAAHLLAKRVGMDLLALIGLALLGQVVALKAHRRDTSRSDAVPAEASAKLNEACPPVRLAVQAGKRTLMLSSDEILWVEAAGNYAVLHAADERYVTRTSLSDLTQELGPSFARASRSAIVNLSAIAAISDATRQGDLVMTLSSGHEVKLTRTYRRSVLQRLPRVR